MLETLFVNTVENSLIISAVIAIMMLLTLLLKKRYSMKWRYFIWLVIAIRLLIPFNLDPGGAPFTLVWGPAQTGAVHKHENPVIPVVDQGGTAATPVAASGEQSHGGILADQRQEISADQQEGSGQGKKDQGTGKQDGMTQEMGASLRTGENGTRFSISQALPVIWLGGIGIFLVVHGFRYFSFMRIVKRWSRPVTDERIREIFQARKNELGIKHKIGIKQCKMIPGPIMTGLLKPAILLPDQNYSAIELEVILKHELIHFQRKDLWYKLILLFANGMHWFNPLIYLMCRVAERDMELTCDDVVVKDADMAYRKFYSEAILQSLKKQGRHSPISTYFHSGKRTMKKRFANLFETKKKGTAIFGLAFVLVLGASVLVASETRKADVAADTGPAANDAGIISGDKLPNRTVMGISGSYKVLDFVHDSGSDQDLARLAGDRLIWEKTISGGIEDSLPHFKHQTILYSVNLNNLDDVKSKTLSSAEQENYAGIRVLGDKIMVKSRTGYYLLDNRLQPLGEPVTFPTELTEDLKRLKEPNGYYFNHFDISSDGRHVYYTDERERSLSCYDLSGQKKTVLASEIDVRADPHDANSEKLPYRLYKMVLTPNDQFMITRVAGYRESGYYVYNLNHLEQSFLTEALPVDVYWSNVQDVIPLYADQESLDNQINQRIVVKQIDLELLDLNDNSRKDMTVSLEQEMKVEPFRLYGAYNKGYLAFTSFDYDKHMAKVYATGGTFDYDEYEVSDEEKAGSLMVCKDNKLSEPIKSQFQLALVGLLDDGRVILKYTGKSKGYILTE